MSTNSAQPPTLFVQNATGNPGIGFPVKINGISKNMTNPNYGVVSLKDMVGQTIRTIEVNGANMTMNPALKITKNTLLRFQHLISGPVKHRFTDETIY